MKAIAEERAALQGVQGLGGKAEPLAAAEPGAQSPCAL
jgi:hypothetical protein